jgi:hypothetical protein
LRSPALLEQPEDHPRQPDKCDDSESDGENLRDEARQRDLPALQERVGQERHDTGDGQQRRGQEPIHGLHDTSQQRCQRELMYCLMGGGRVAWRADVFTGLLSVTGPDRHSVIYVINWTGAVASAGMSGLERDRSSRFSPRHRVEAAIPDVPDPSLLKLGF